MSAYGWWYVAGAFVAGAITGHFGVSLWQSAVVGIIGGLAAVGLVALVKGDAR